MPSARHYHSGHATSWKNFSYPSQSSVAPSSVTWNVQTSRASSSTTSWWTRYTSTVSSAAYRLCLRMGQQQFVSKIAASSSTTSYPCLILRTRLKCSTWARWSLDLCSCVRVIVCLRNGSSLWWLVRRSHFCWSSWAMKLWSAACSRWSVAVQHSSMLNWLRANANCWLSPSVKTDPRAGDSSILCAPRITNIALKLLWWVKISWSLLKVRR